MPLSKFIPSLFGKRVSFWIQLPWLEVNVWYFAFHPYLITDNYDDGMLRVDRFGSTFKWDDLVGLSVSRLQPLDSWLDT